MNTLQRARADQIETLFGQWSRTTGSMLLGAVIMMVVMRNVAAPSFFAAWLAAIMANQLARRTLVARYRAAAPQGLEREAWGQLWAIGSTVAGALWGVAGVVLFRPEDPSQEVLLIVCLFGVALGAVDLTALYRRSFYGFVLTALLPLIVRVALEGDALHLSLAAVMTVVLVFVLRSGRNLNTLMTQSLAIRHEKLDLIAELQAQTTAAGAARSAAESSNREKTRFLAAASHDLRQPLHAMGLFAAALSTKVRDPEVQDMIASINASVEALEHLFDALMDISRLDAGGVAPQRSPFSLSRLLQRVEHDHRPLAAEKGLRFTVRNSAAWVDSDAVLVARILSNLVSNAVRHTARGGVLVGVRRSGEHCLLQVWDTGPGIPSEMRERIFDEFHQLGNAERNSGHGIGLGLSIVRRLAILLGHRLELDSQLGRGSCFALQLPVAPRPVTLPACRTPARRRTDVKDGLADCRIAVIEDEPLAARGMCTLLQSWGATVVSAHSGAAMLDALGRSGFYPDLIVADYRLGDDETGIDVIARMRDELGVVIPALLVSGDVGEDAVAAMRACGDSGVARLLKPVAPSALRTAAETLLRRGQKKPRIARGRGVSGAFELRQVLPEASDHD